MVFSIYLKAVDQWNEDFEKSSHQIIRSRESAFIKTKKYYPITAFNILY